MTTGRSSVMKSVMKSIMILVLLVLVRTVHAGLAISPAYVEVALDKGRPSGEFTVTNTGEAVERYRITSLNFTFTREGGIKRLDVDDNCLASWIIFNPKEFDLPPKSKRNIRFVISPHGVPRPGEYTAGMELESLNTSVASSKDGGGREMKVQVVSSILVPIFAQMGKVENKGELRETLIGTRNDITAVKCVFANQGTARLLITGEFEVLDSNGKSVVTGELPKCYVLRETERLLTAPLKDPLPDGKYTVKTKISCTQLEKSLTQEITMDWKNPPPPAVTTKPAPAATTPPVKPAAKPETVPPAAGPNITPTIP